MRLSTWFAILLLLGAPIGARGADLCGDADGNGNVTVSDGVQTLRAAAGLSTTCTPERCDVDGGGTVSVSDGVNVLRAAAGLSVRLQCPSGGSVDCTGALVRLALDVPEPIGAAQLELTYPPASVAIPGTGDEAASRVDVLTTTSLLAGGQPNDLDDRILFSLLAPDGLGDGPLLAIDFDCFDLVPDAVQFRCTVSDAFAPDGLTAVTGATCTVQVVPEP
jgi:hypothetical protein